MKGRGALMFRCKWYETEDEGSMTLCNVGNHPQNDDAKSQNAGILSLISCSDLHYDLCCLCMLVAENNSDYF
jgi:hypothetical protein